MVASSTLDDWIVPRIQDQPRLAKPPLTYWLQSFAAIALDQRSAAVTPWGGGIWVYRLPSLVAALVAVWATWRLGRSLFGTRTAWLGALLLGCCPMVLWDARQARADELLLAFTVVAQWSLWTAWNRRREALLPRWVAVTFWLAVAGGIMAKGPVTPVIAALTIVTIGAVTHEWRWAVRLRPLLGLTLVTALVGAWVVAVSTRVGWQRFASSVVDEVIGRGLSPKEGHWGPPGYYLVAAFGLFWPGSLLMGPALFRAARRAVRANPIPEPPRRITNAVYRVRCRRAADLFCLGWLAPSWMVFEFLGTKLPHYTLPLYPSLALLTARFAIAPGWQTMPERGRHLLRSAICIGLSIGSSVIVIALIGLSYLARDSGASAVLFGVGGGAIAAALSFKAALLMRREEVVRSLSASLAALLVASTVIFTLLPRVQAVWLSPRLVTLLRSIDPGGQRPLAAVEFHEDSLVFLVNGRVQRIQAAELAQWLERHPRGIAIVPATGSAEETTHILGEVEGLNYSNGRWLRLQLIEPVGRAR
jgi:4-amino-4-deoxy-L-arabinose transferase-like glycosyltransferase